MENWKNYKIGKTILFYLYTGCRLQEGFNAILDFDKMQLRITRTKTEEYEVSLTVMPISKQFCDLMRDDWETVFLDTPYKKTGEIKTYSESYIGKKITDFLQALGIQDKSPHETDFLPHDDTLTFYRNGQKPIAMSKGWEKAPITYSIEINRPDSKPTNKRNGKTYYRTPKGKG